jgi:hypothetical protein
LTRTAWSNLPKTAAATVLGQLGQALPKNFKTVLPEPIRLLANRLLRWSSPTAPYVRRLWGGFSASAIADLETIAGNDELAPAYRSEALLALAVWFATFGNYEKALNLLDRRDEVSPHNKYERRHLVPRLMFLCSSGAGIRAAALLDSLPNAETTDTFDLVRGSTCSFSAAGIDADPEMALAHINVVFRRHGLAEIARRNSSMPLGIDNLIGIDVPRVPNADQLVSVIVPAYNSVSTISTALTSLAEQSWTNLEVLVVDDASTDDTLAVALQFAAADPRFQVIKRTVNGGSYVCRNAALKQARGEYITVLDGDDWAHPQRIAVHVAALRADRARFNLSAWVRTTDDLLFSGASRASSQLPLRNMGSFFVSRQVVDRIGGWNEVRIAADTEYMKRAVLAFGGGKLPVPIRGAVPLTFGRLVSTSLTRAAATSMITINHGVRREYHEAMDYWHARTRAGVLPISELPERLARVAPATIRPDRGVAEYDVLLIGDWNAPGESQDTARILIAEAKKQHRTAAVFHYSHYESDPAVPLSWTFRHFLYGSETSVLAAGESAKAKRIIVVDPSVFRHGLDRFPSLSYDSLAVLEPPSDLHRIDLDVARKNIAAAFGEEGRWISVVGGELASLLA